MWDTGMDGGRQRGADRNAAGQRLAAQHCPAAGTVTVGEVHQKAQYKL